MKRSIGFTPSTLRTVNSTQKMRVSAMVVSTAVCSRFSSFAPKACATGMIPDDYIVVIIQGGKVVSASRWSILLLEYWDRP